MITDCKAKTEFNMKSYLIHFIRHGAIDETLAGKYIGVTDVALSEKGKAELRRLDYFPRFRYTNNEKQERYKILTGNQRL